jgi:putative hydrolase of the HAD superfamily/pyrimidine and pyridine-specific 5'-nucleotidase
MDAILFGLTVIWTTREARKDPSRTLRWRLLSGTSLNATERVCIVTPDNQVILHDERSGAAPVSRAEMRLRNLWHRATYVLIVHQAEHICQHEDVYVIVQRRSEQKDYCPGLLDPTPGGVVGYNESYLENAERELKEELGIDVSTGGHNSLDRLFSFPYEDDRVRVWGDFYLCTFRGALKDLTLQESEVAEILRISLTELRQRIRSSTQDFMPDSLHALQLYFQWIGDQRVKRRLLRGYSSANVDAYGLRPKVEALFFDCDDCLYFDGWQVANKLTSMIDEWCVRNGLEPGQAYQLYKQYGTALRGLLAEGYLEETESAIDGFLRDVHDIGVNNMLQRDDELRAMLLRMDPSIPKYIFTASVAHHADNCLRALGIQDLFVSIIDCKQCEFESKHSEHSFRVAMRVAGIDNPECCLFFDDNIANIKAARSIGWRSVLVGRVGRDCGRTVSSEHAELEVDRIHDLPSVLPELFGYE